MSEKRAVVLGASGMVGLPLAKALKQNGWQVTGAARFSVPASKEELLASGIDTCTYDFTSEDPKQLPDCDVVFLQVWDRQRAWTAGEDESFALNYDAVGRVAVRYAGNAHIVNGSTISLYGPRGDRFSHESDLPLPNNAYGLVRIAQEKLISFLCNEAGSRAVHLRYCHSNSTSSGAIRRLAEQIVAGKDLGDNPDAQIQVIALEDFVACTVKAGEQIAAGGELPAAINIVHPRVWSMRELATHIQQVLGTGEVRFSADSGGRDGSIWADPGRMCKYFGEPTVDLEELIEDICQTVKAEA